MEEIDWKQEIDFFKKMAKPLYHSKEFLSKSNEEIMKEAEERQMRARAYEAEWLKQLQQKAVEEANQTKANEKKNS